MFLCVIMKYNYAIKAEMETTMEIQMWKEILTPYDLAVEELQIKFNHIIKEYRQAGVYSPIEQVLGRVKRQNRNPTDACAATTSVMVFLKEVGKKNGKYYN